MDVKQLRYFVTIVDSCSLSKAAERLFVAQPALSQQILNLEKELSVQLLIRSPKGVGPTEAGKTLYRLARDVLRGMDLIRKEVKEEAGTEAGTVSVGFPATVGSVLAAPLFRKVKQTYPAIRLQIYENVSSRINELLAQGRLDLAVLFRDSDCRGISGRSLFDENIFVVGKALYELDIDNNVCPVSKLNNIPIVAPGPENGLRLLLERTFAQAEATLNILADIDSVPTMIDIAESGDACVMFAASILANCHFSSATPVRKIVEPEMIRSASLCWNNSVPPLAATYVVQTAIVDLVAELQTDGKLVGVAAL